MTSRTLYKQEDILKKLAELNGDAEVPWALENRELVFSHTFKDFRAAFSFLTKVALVSEKLDHHATIQNTYNQVTLRLSTHDVEGITEFDFHWIQLLKAS